MAHKLAAQVILAVPALLSAMLLKVTTPHALNVALVGAHFTSTEVAHAM